LGLEKWYFLKFLSVNFFLIKKTGTAGSDFGNAIAIDSDDNVYYTGYTNVDFFGTNYGFGHISF